MDSRDDLLADMSRCEASIADHTRYLLWPIGLALLAGVMMPNMWLLAGSLTGYVAVWAMRRYKVAWIGVTLSCILVSLAVCGVLAKGEVETLADYMDVVLVTIIVSGAIGATLDVRRYRRTERELRRLVDGGVSE